MSTDIQVHNNPAPVEGPGTALAEIRPAPRLLVPVAAPAEIIAAQEATRELITKALKPGRDYGTVPGIDKPFLQKPGAERITIGMGCYFGEPRISEKEIDHDRVVRWVKRKKRGGTWVEESGESLGLYRYVIAVPVVHRESGQVVGEGVGSCSTMESKYIDRPRDSENTVLKMAHKRAAVAATLLAFGLSDQFTQDEDTVEPVEHRGNAAPRSSTRGTAPADEPQPHCPVCEGDMWDNRTSKTNPKAPDYKCKDRSCEGVYWPGQWPPKGPDPRQEEIPQDDDDDASDTPQHSGLAAKRFPRSRQFPRLAGQPLGAISTRELTEALTYSRAHGADELADAISEVLADRPQYQDVPGAVSWQDDSDLVDNLDDEQEPTLALDTPPTRQRNAIAEGR